jgi:ureidoacrylate peracid hydrolase
MYGIAKNVTDQIIARQGKLHYIDRIDAARSALIVVDLQNYFMKPGFQAEIPAARDIVPAVNRAAGALRALGGTVVWIQTASDNADREWSFLHHSILGPKRSQRRLTELAEGAEGHALWPELETKPDDLFVTKRRYSVFIPGSSGLEAQLRSRGIDTVLIAGTATNVCCESTARDAMMLNFKTVMVADALAAATPAAHADSLTNCIQYFSDVMNVDEVVSCMGRQAAAA